VHGPACRDKKCPNPSETGPSCRYYVVQGGDYMTYIAAGFGVSVDALLEANKDLGLSSTLAPGQRVKIPPFPETCGRGTAARFPTEGVSLCRVYNILEGDSLASIAVKFGSTVADLVALNPEFTDPNLLQPGKQIKIPVGRLGGCGVGGLCGGWIAVYAAG
jgi:LysM repeat protein